MLGEVDPQETVFWRLAEHWYMNSFSCFQSRKNSSLWETSFRNLRSLAVNIGNMEIYLQFEIFDNLTFHWYRLHLGMLYSFLVFCPRKCIRHIRTPCMRLHGHQSRTGAGGCQDHNNFFSLPKIKPEFLNPSSPQPTRYTDWNIPVLGKTTENNQCNWCPGGDSNSI
jgi:hypothetical protein